MIAYNVKESLALLAAKGVDPGMVSRGSLKPLTAHDVSAALAGLDLGPHLYARVKYAGDMDSAGQLIDIVEDVVRAIATAHGWKFKDDAILRRIALQALREMEVVPCSCKTCRGRGAAMIGKLKRVCPSCGGSGRRQWREATRARALGVARTSFRGRWAARMFRVLNELTVWERWIGYALARQFRRQVDW